MEAILKIQKWGNGLGINIPSVVANDLSLKEGLYVRVQKNRNGINIEPKKTIASYNLTDMLNEITDNNIHHCIETGKPLGNELW